MWHTILKSVCFLHSGCSEMSPVCWSCQMEVIFSQAPGRPLGQSHAVCGHQPFRARLPGLGFHHLRSWQLKDMEPWAGSKQQLPTLLLHGRFPVCTCSDDCHAHRSESLGVI